jgi:hypothetical protein
MGRSACIAAKRLGFGIGVFTVPKFAAAIFGRHGVSILTNTIPRWYGPLI